MTTDPFDPDRVRTSGTVQRGMTKRTITVRLPRVLRRFTDEQRQVEIPGSTIGEVIENLIATYPGLEERMIEDGKVRRHLKLFANDEQIDRDTAFEVELEPGSTLFILAPVRGGSGRSGKAEDVRMKGFRTRTSIDEALKVALDGIDGLPAEDIPVTESAGRVLAEAAVSEVNVPPFRRATMDGYAVVAADTFGASLYNPVILNLAGESMPGRGTPEALLEGAARRIMTGAPVPDGADAVVRAEDTAEAGSTVEIRAAVAAGKNVGRVGEDITAGSEVLPAGRRLRPEDAGLLSSIGVAPVAVRSKPKVRIIVSGNELLAPGSRPDGSHIVDSNSVMLAGLVERDGGTIERIERLPDERDVISEALACPGADVIVTAGGASVGLEDFLPMLVDELGALDVHGVAMRPSSPTGIGRVGNARVLLLPGNPVSCLVAYDFFAGPVIRTLGGLPPEMPYRCERLPLGGRLVSQIGRTDYARVRIDDGIVRPLAIAGASVLSSVTGADGFVIVPAGSEGFAEGAVLDVFRYGTSAW